MRSWENVSVSQLLPMLPHMGMSQFLISVFRKVVKVRQTVGQTSLHRLDQSGGCLSYRELMWPWSPSALLQSLMELPGPKHVSLQLLVCAQPMLWLRFREGASSPRSHTK